MVDSHDGPPPEARPPQLADLLSLCRSLNRESVRYVVVGGMAMIQAGFVRATEDIDARIGAPEGAIVRVVPGGPRREHSGRLAAAPGRVRAGHFVRSRGPHEGRRRPPPAGECRSLTHRTADGRRGPLAPEVDGRRRASPRRGLDPRARPPFRRAPEPRPPRRLATSLPTPDSKRPSSGDPGDRAVVEQGEPP